MLWRIEAGFRFPGLALGDLLSWTREGMKQGDGVLLLVGVAGYP